MINIVCLKWGDKYSADYVNRLYTMVSRNYNKEFRFYCCTEDSNGINPKVNIIPLPKYDIEKWWWKLWFFSEKFPITGKCLYFDLDTVIQNDITPLVDYSANCPHFVEGRVWYRNADPEKSAYRINSSIILWNTETINYDIWEEFYSKKEYYIQKYGSEDNYLEKVHDAYVKTIPTDWVYSRLMGFDDSHPEALADKYRPKVVYDNKTNKWHRLFYMPDRMICLLNGLSHPLTPQCISDHGYLGLEKYWK